MIFTIAAGILVASIPLGIIAFGLIGVIAETEGGGDTGGPALIILFGFAVAAALIWYGFSHTAS